VALIFIRHARDRMDRDGIAAAWVEAIILKPEHSMPHSDDSALTLAWRRIPELYGRGHSVGCYLNNDKVSRSRERRGQPPFAVNDFLIFGFRESRRISARTR
jgi:hypothetical protein